jgi:hypothetical protein
MSGKLKVLTQLSFFSWNLLVSDYIHRNSTFWPVWYSVGWSPNFHYKWHIQQRTDIGKYSFVNRSIKSWNQLPASLLASFPCKLNTFRKWILNVVTSKGIQVGIECKKVKCSDVEWTDVIYVKWFHFEVKWGETKWSEVRYGVALGDKSVMYVRVTLYWVYLIILWLFYLGTSCTAYVLTSIVFLF